MHSRAYDKSIDYKNFGSFLIIRIPYTRKVFQRASQKQNFFTAKDKLIFA